ncbi:MULTISPECIES: IS5 family transposase [Parvibaculum]|uniref:IS5 family transposase n=1 Tax=Parvibaculum TaxID=256616 RepID=UPI000C5E195D|nr:MULTISPECIES: IS5 family transposase [Parvibaculum]MAM93332.1 IS5/IS1182 family transposase [Parvibaculum sp.]
MLDLYWLSDDAWARLEPHLPHNQPGRPRVDDRRVISGILHILKTGARWRDVPPEYGPAKTIYNRYTRWAHRGVWQRIFAKVAAGGAIPDELMLDSSHVKAHRSASGGKGGSGTQAVGVSRGGRTTKIHCLADACGRIVAIALTPGNIADISMAMPLLEAIAPAKRLLADKAYDADRLRNWLGDRQIEAIIPGRATRNAAYALNRPAYRRRNIIERMFGKLKNWKRIATRYDRLAVNFLAAIALVALATQWLK